MSIVIAGYYGFGNAGDELILLSLVRRFRRESPVYAITVLSNNPAATQKEFGVAAVHRWRPWAWVRPLLRSQRFVLGGGGLLQEDSGPWNHFYYLSLVAFARMLGCRTEIVAIGVDPIAGSLNRFWTRWVLNHWTDELSVRDFESRQALLDAGVEGPIAVQADPVADLEIVPRPQRVERIAFAISPSGFDGDPAQDIANLCDAVASRYLMPVDFLVFFKEEDTSLASRVASLTKAETRVRVWENPTDLLAWVPDYPLVIASRFHALVLAAGANVSYIGWGKQKKVASFCAVRRMPYWPTADSWNQQDLLYSETGRFLVKI